MCPKTITDLSDLATAQPALLGIDWGTTSLRGALLAANGGVIDARESPRGLLQVPPGGWEQVFEEVFADWLARHPGLPVLMCGMVGSRQGWVEAPYCACPATAADLAARLTWVRPGRIAIVPGLSFEAGGMPDVMRGEETQVLGALALLGAMTGEALTLVLPGTHSKWVQVRGGCVTGFATQMTGECYALFRQHSILARTLPADEPAFDAAAFDDGIDRAADAGGLLHHLFGVRTQALFDRSDGAALASCLSGLVIGEELRAQPMPHGERIVLVGSPALTARYARAFERRGQTCTILGAEATWAGLSLLGRLAVPARDTIDR